MFNDFHKLLSHYSLYLLNKILMVFNWHIYIYIMYFSLSLSCQQTQSSIGFDQLSTGLWLGNPIPTRDVDQSAVGAAGLALVCTHLGSKDRLFCTEMLISWVVFSPDWGLLKDQAQSLAIVLDAKFTGQRPVLLVKTRHAKLKGEHW